jgi:GTPase
MVFVDTPGIHKTRTALHKSMVESAIAVFHEVDLLVLMMEMGRPDDLEGSPVFSILKGIRKPCFLVINKIDTAPKENLLPLISRYSQRYPFDAILPISAVTGEGVSELLDELKSRLLPGPQFFPEDMETDQTETFMVSEIIREKIYLHLKDELPYASAVTVEHFMEDTDKDLLRIEARIHVETDSQKGILIGKGGRMIKTIGQSARRELEKRFGMRIYLGLTVRVEKNWSKDARALRRLGY